MHLPEVLPLSALLDKHTHTHTRVHISCSILSKIWPSPGQRGHRGVHCVCCCSPSDQEVIRKQRTHESIAKLSQAPNDMQWYAVARCVAMVKEMIGQALDYSVRFPKQPACTHTAAAQHTQTHTHTHTLTHTHNLTQGSAEISRLIAVVLRVKPFEWKWKCITKTHRHQEQLWVREMTCYENILCTSQLEVERSACVYGGERSQRVKLLVRAPEKPPIRSFTFRLLEMLLCASYYDLMLLFIEHNFLGVRRQAGTSSTIDSSTKASHLKAVAQINTFRQQWLITHYHVSALNKPTRVPHNASRTICLAYPQSFSQDWQSHDTPRTHNSKWCGSPPQCILQGHCSLVVETGRDDLWTCWHCL